MKISYNWLKDFIHIRESPEEIAEILTQTGLEVEGLEKVEKIKGGLEGLVIGEIKECKKHPNADKLSLTRVDIGNENLSPIVCGAPNVAVGQKVVVATVNSTLYPTGHEPFKIKKAKIRGEVSEGMICAEDEIGLGTKHDGIMVLDTKLPNGTPALELFDTGEDHVFEIGLTPNRGDATSHLGTARDLKAFFNRNICFPEISEFTITPDNPINVEVENHKACPRYAGVTIRNIRVADSPDWLQWRLRAIGLEPINNVVDITNYILHSLGQPLHAFDAEVVGSKVIVKNLKKGSKFTSLDEKERKLHQDDLMICNEEGGMCIAGVFGGIKSGVKGTTTAIFLESAYFSQDHIRATAMRHGLSTDASFRFERGIDPEITLFALQVATQMILEIAGGKVASEFIDIYPEKIQPVRIPTEKSTFDKLIGSEIPLERIKEILKLLDISIENESGDSFDAVVPPYRSEVTREADLIEEVLRIYGINNIEIDESFSTDYLAEFNEIEPYKLQEELSYYLSGKGYHEILTNSLTSHLYDEKIGLNNRENVSVLNPSSEELSTLKSSPLYTALESVKFNINRKQPNLKFFEFSKSYNRTDSKLLEKEVISLYVSGKSWPENWLATPINSSIHLVSGHLEDILSKTGLPGWSTKPIEESSVYQYGLEFLIGKHQVASAGKLRDEILEVYGIQQSVFYAEIDWDFVKENSSKDYLYQPISKFPEVRRDLSLVLDKNIPYSEIEKIAFQNEKKLLTRINLFSVFEGEQIGHDKKAYAAAFYLQDREKTLTDKQIDKSMNRLMGQFEKQLNAIIRK